LHFQTHNILPFFSKIEFFNSRIKTQLKISKALDFGIFPREWVSPKGARKYSIHVATGVDHT
jgi:hypothetical protein